MKRSWSLLKNNLSWFPVALHCLQLVDKEAKALQLDLGLAAEIATYQQEFMGTSMKSTFLRCLERCGLAEILRAFIAENNLQCTLEDFAARMDWEDE